MTNFEKVGLFMKTFGQEVKKTSELSSEKINSLRLNLIQEELDELKKLLIRVDQYQVKTEQKFKDYTSRTSRQTKMQNAYRQSGG